MSPRAQPETITRQWISLWCAPLNWALFDRLHVKRLLVHVINKICAIRKPKSMPLDGIFHEVLAGGIKIRD